MTQTLFRARLVDFTDHPDETGSGMTAALRYVEDGAVLVEQGRIRAAGDYAAVAGLAGDARVIDHRPYLMMAGFIDPHIHFPQVQVVASWGAQLLDWLNTYTFPEEARFHDPAHAAAMAEVFVTTLLRHGTTTAAAFGSVHPVSVDALFTAAQSRGMAMIAGKVMMDRNARPDVQDTAQSAYDDSLALIHRWHGRGRLRYAITPRFAITSTPEQLAAAGALARDWPQCHIQTHLSENLDEIALTLSLYPKARDYLDIYDHYGLLGPRMLLGHCIHLSDREIARMADTGSRAISCPTSNLFLGSGLFDDKGLRRAGVVTGVATDIGGGTSYSMLHTLNEAYKVAALRGDKLHPVQAFYWATLGNARAIGLEDEIGSLAPGRMADLVVLDARATPEMALRMERADRIEHELFVIQIMGDDRAIRQTYVAGQPML